MRKVTFVLAFVLSAFLLLPLNLYAGSNIEIVQVNFSPETNEITIKGVNLTFFGIPSVSIGDSVLVDVCDYNSDSEIVCDISNTTAAGGGSFPLRLSAGNAPHLNAEIDVYIPASSIAANCVPGDIIMCYSGDPATINIGFCGAGYRACGNDGTWGECMNEVTPETEICDYTDNDCDGDIDEEFPLLNTYCQEGLGACQNFGVYICDPDDSSSVICSVEAGTSSPEVCNGIDDDCNGIIDDDYYIGDSCGVGACSGGHIVCSQDSLEAVCSTDSQATVEICNGADDDCDGIIDEELVQPPCFNGIGVCSGITRICLGASGWSDCNYPVDYEETETLCDNKDNDCDGVIDEGCECPDSDQDGYDDAACGGTDCNDNDPTINPGVTGDNPAGPLCSDGIDNDCDGSDAICFAN